MTVLHNTLNQSRLSLDVADALLKTDEFAFAVIDASFRILKVSNNFKHLTSTDHDPLGLTLESALWEFVGMEDELTAVLHNKSPKFQLQHISRTLSDGSDAYLHFEVTAQKLQNHQPGLFLLIQDQTELGIAHQRLTQQKNKLYLLKNELDNTNQTLNHTIKMKDVFLSMATHDMRNPLSAIMGYASLLMSTNGVKDESARDEMLHAIIDQSNHLNFLIDDIVIVDKLKNGQLVLDIEETAVDDILTKTIEALGPIIEKKHLTFHLTLQQEPLLVPVDKQRFWQITYNLLSNSLKYTPDWGKVEVNAKLTKTKFVLRVSDNGLGISKENLAKLFNIYYRTDSARTSSISGNGIGLYIVKTIVEAHQGDIFVESTVGEGSTFIIELPLLGQNT